MGVLRDQLFERIAASVWLNQAAGRIGVFPRYGHFFELNLPDTPRLINYLHICSVQGLSGHVRIG